MSEGRREGSEERKSASHPCPVPAATGEHGARAARGGSVAGGGEGAGRVDGGREQAGPWQRAGGCGWRSCPGLAAGPAILPRRT
jgi:hypothetical protein